jgi:hypothetical protein
LPSFVSTADAISKYLTDDREWCRLSDEFHKITRDPGALGVGPKEERQLEVEVRAELAKRELASRENYLFGNVYQAAVQQELQVLLMDGCRTFQLPGLYTYDMADALRSGWAGKLRLTGLDTAWRDARLVFREADWQRWRESQAQPRVPAAIGTGSQSDDRTGLDRVRAVMQGIKLQGKQLRRSDFDAMVRELVDRRIKADTLDARWRELAPEEWRKPGQGPPPAGLMVHWKEYLPPR